MAQTDSYTHDAPFDAGFLNVDDIHKIHYEQYGKKDEKPGTFSTPPILPIALTDNAQSFSSTAVQAAQPTRNAQASSIQPSTA